MNTTIFNEFKYYDSQLRYTERQTKSEPKKNFMTPVIHKQANHTSKSASKEKISVQKLTAAQSETPSSALKTMNELIKTFFQSITY